MAANRLLVLFDGNAIVHRAHHAFAQRPLSVRRTGEVVSAVYGFAAMLIKAAHELKPSHWAVALDYPAPTFRHRQYDKYKEHRPPQPEELRPQFRRVRELAAAFAIPIYEVEGFEADDVLGTLGRQAEAQGIDTVIVTGDTDTMQLVTPRVKVLYIRAGRMGSFSDTELYDEVRVREKFGVPPAALPDLKGLKGDPSDNIPGVSGIGDKTAQRLLQEFGSLDAVYQGLDRVAPPKVQALLRTGEALALQSRVLARIVTEAPVALSLEACDIGAFDRSRVVGLFRELEFSSLLGRLPERVGADIIGPEVEVEVEAEAPPPPEAEAPPLPVTAAPPPQGEYRVVQDGPGLEALLRELGGARELSVDVETTGKDERTAQLVGIALSFRPGDACYIPVAHLGWQEQLPLSQVLEALRPAFTSPSLPKVAHNGKYDVTVLWRCGVLVSPLSFDTMVAAHLLGEKSLGLKALAFSRLGVEMTPITALIGTGAKQLTMAQVPVPQATRYAAADADMTLRLKGHVEAELRRENLWDLFSTVEMPLLPLLFHMERAGVLLDLALLRELAYTLGADIIGLEREIYAAVGHRFNINSSQQLAAVLYDELHLPRSRRTKTGYSTEAAVLEELKDAHPVIPLLLDYRLLTKLKSTYVDTLPALVDEEGRVHTIFNQTGTATGRLSSSDPNLQNIPVRGEWGRRIRRAFIAPPGSVLLAGDYSQIDLRVLAHLSQDPTLLAAFRNDEDIHTATAAQVFGVAPAAVTPDMRRVAKTVNFGVIYGMSGFGLEQATDLSREEASAFIRAYFEKYPGVKQYMDSTKEMARQRGYVETLLGRRRYIPDIKSLNRQLREATERMAINMPVQGTTADIMKRAMLDVHRGMERRGLKSRMLLQVHDELIFEVPRGEEGEMRRLVAEVMPRPGIPGLSVPLKADIKAGHNWGEME